jgi:hypothetical protein
MSVMASAEAQPVRSQGSVEGLITALTWPVISLIITGAWHLGVEAIWPDLRNLFIAPALAPLLLAYGAWAGYRTVTISGSFVVAVVAGAILGLLPLMLDIVGFGLLLGRGLDVGLLAGVFGLSMVLFGGILGGGFGHSRRSGG